MGRRIPPSTNRHGGIRNRGGCQPRAPDPSARIPRQPGMNQPSIRCPELREPPVGEPPGNLPPPPWQGENHLVLRRGAPRATPPGGVPVLPSTGTCNPMRLRGDRTGQGPNPPGKPEQTRGLMPGGGGIVLWEWRGSEREGTPGRKGRRGERAKPRQQRPGPSQPRVGTGLAEARHGIIPRESHPLLPCLQRKGPADSCRWCSAPVGTHRSTVPEESDEPSGRCGFRWRT